MCSSSTTQGGKDVARELRAARRAAEITRADLATLAGCPYASLSLLESGYLPRHSPVLARVRAALRAVDRRAPTDEPDASDDRLGCPGGRPA
jgi:hypothetical protein